jgi:hypothetical protein
MSAGWARRSVPVCSCIFVFITVCARSFACVYSVCVVFIRLCMCQRPVCACILAALLGRPPAWFVYNCVLLAVAVGVLQP